MKNVHFLVVPLLHLSLTSGSNQGQLGQRVSGTSPYLGHPCPPSYEMLAHVMPPLKHQAWNQLVMHQEWNQLSMIPSFFNLSSLPSCNEYVRQGRSRPTCEAVEADQPSGRWGQTMTRACASISGAGCGQKRTRPVAGTRPAWLCLTRTLIWGRPRPVRRGGWRTRPTNGPVGPDHDVGEASSWSRRGRCWERRAEVITGACQRADGRPPCDRAAQH
jgi:hypothetical protein